MNGTGPEKVSEGVYRVTGADRSDYRDSCAYLIDFGEPLLIDGGSGFGFDEMVANIKSAGYQPGDIRSIILTHCHFDHIGGAFIYRHHFQSRITMHEMDAQARAALYVKAQQLILADAPWQPLYTPVDVVASRAHVKDLVIGAMGRALMNDAQLVK